MIQNDLLTSVQAAIQSGNQPEAMQEINRIVDFCIQHENGKVFDDWDRGIIELMVAYHAAKDTLIVDYDKDDIKGVFMWYNCDYEDDWNFVLQWEPDREDGDSIFMAFLFADSTEAFRNLTRFFTHRIQGQDKHLIGIRHRNGVPTRVEYTPKLFKKILELK